MRPPEHELFCLQVSLLDSGATARVTEIAAKSLANLGSAPNNRMGIRLAGGIPPLVALLVEQPTPQVSSLVMWSRHLNVYICRFCVGIAGARSHP